MMLDAAIKDYGEQHSAMMADAVKSERVIAMAGKMLMNIAKRDGWAAVIGVCKGSPRVAFMRLLRGIIRMLALMGRMLMGVRMSAMVMVMTVIMRP